MMAMLATQTHASHLLPRPEVSEAAATRAAQAEDHSNDGDDLDHCEPPGRMRCCGDLRGLLDLFSHAPAEVGEDAVSELWQVAALAQVGLKRGTAEEGALHQPHVHLVDLGNDAICSGNEDYLGARLHRRCPQPHRLVSLDVLAGVCGVQLLRVIEELAGDVRHDPVRDVRALHDEHELHVAQERVQRGCVAMAHCLPLLVPRVEVHGDIVAMDVHGGNIQCKARTAYEVVHVLVVTFLLGDPQREVKEIVPVTPGVLEHGDRPPGIVQR
mmetsp:Transcript_89041/g.207227  ORF Transcript_89041/g.207227 Transcript_89041/m.207227 type:complete len:270 (+) Transcript_89041:55-864(+)